MQNHGYDNVEQLLKDIESMTMDPLRNLARKFDIVPGTKKRAELERLIAAVFMGEVQPQERVKKGRPTRSSTGNQVSIDDNMLRQNLPQLTDDLPDSNFEDVEQQSQQPAVSKADFAEGILEIMPDGFGFLRTQNYSTTPHKDIYVPPTQIKRFNLRTGDKIKCQARVFPDRTAPSLIFIHEINDRNCKENHRTPFDSLMPCHPNERITLECEKTDYALRIIDLVAPIGKGQRGLIVAPPKTGKTVLLKKIAQATRRNHPDIHLTVLLIDERPEEVTDFKESVDCEVVYSTFDQTPQHHTQIAELVISNAKRRVEQGQDVMILMDSITRLARAYNQTAEQSGRTLTGGLDITALQEPKKLFGAGRNISGQGSLTILATALIDTGSRMDDIIYEEFKGTGNMEIHLDRKMSERRIFPAIDLYKSGTRREELLLTQSQLEGMYLVRRALGKEDNGNATEELLDMLTCTANNQEFIDMLKVVMRSNSKKAIN